MFLVLIIKATDAHHFPHEGKKKKAGVNPVFPFNPVLPFCFLLLVCVQIWAMPGE